MTLGRAGAGQGGDGGCGRHVRCTAQGGGLRLLERTCAVGQPEGRAREVTGGHAEVRGRSREVRTSQSSCSCDQRAWGLKVEHPQL